MSAGACLAAAVAFGLATACFASPPALPTLVDSAAVADADHALVLEENHREAYLRKLRVDGTTVWRIRVPDEAASVVAVADVAVVKDVDATFRAYDLATGRHRWSHTAGDAATMTTAGDTLVVETTADTSGYLGVDAKTGEQRWWSPPSPRLANSDGLWRVEGAWLDPTDGTRFANGWNVDCIVAGRLWSYHWDEQDRPFVHHRPVHDDTAPVMVEPRTHPDRVVGLRRCGARGGDPIAVFSELTSVGEVRLSRGPLTTAPSTLVVDRWIADSTYPPLPWSGESLPRYLPIGVTSRDLQTPGILVIDLDLMRVADEVVLDRQDMWRVGIERHGDTFLVTSGRPGGTLRTIDGRTGKLTLALDLAGGTFAAGADRLWTFAPGPFDPRRGGWAVRRLATGDVVGGDPNATAALPDRYPGP